MNLLKIILIVILLIIETSCKTIADENEKKFPYRPNIIWIVVEDMSDHWGCYGETAIQTPHLDRLAAEGELFENAFVTSPVCSPSRSAMITGMYQSTIGAHNHRSQNRSRKGGGNEAYYESYNLPDEVPFLPQLFKQAGYYTALGGEPDFAKTKSTPRGKSDYNFIWDNKWYDDSDWMNRAPGQPFFAQIQLEGGKYRQVKLENPVDPSKVKLPPYYPDDEILRKDWATYLNSIIYLDQQVGEIMAQLKREGIEDSTAIFIFTDHGISHMRGKQYLYEEGMKIPLIVKWPYVTQAGTRRDELISHIDISATSLYLAGIPIPVGMQGRSFFGKNYQPREFVFAGRDRCDETVDLIRAIRTERFKYIRNYFPFKPHAQPNQYKDRKEIIQHMRELYENDPLNPHFTPYFEPVRPVEELYDLKNDPYEMNNLAQDPQYRDTLVKLQKMLIATIHETNDMGFIPEPIAEELGQKYGNKYHILDQPENDDLLNKCLKVMKMDEENDLKGLRVMMHDNEKAVRFWAAYGLGNMISPFDEETLFLLTTALEDESDAVKIAAARALCKFGHVDPALQILKDNLDNQNLLVGLYAALFIEELDQKVASQILPAIKEAQNSPYDFTLRVINRMVINLSKAANLK